MEATPARLVFAAAGLVSIRDESSLTILRVRGLLLMILGAPAFTATSACRVFLNSATVCGLPPTIMIARSLLPFNSAPGAMTCVFAAVIGCITGTLGLAT